MNKGIMNKLVGSLSLVFGGGALGVIYRGFAEIAEESRGEFITLMLPVGFVALVFILLGLFSIYKIKSA